MAEHEAPPLENPRDDRSIAEKNTGKLTFTQPKLTFVKPELVKQGGFAEVTGQFFGTFFP